MSALGYYVHNLDALHWLTRAQRSLVIKNKVRKELWADLCEIIHWYPLNSEERAEYLRIPQASFVALQTFCLTDGKGADTVSNDQLLNFCTTIAELRSQLPASLSVGSLTRVRSPSVVSSHSVEHDDDDDRPPKDPKEKKTVVSSSGPSEVDVRLGRATL